MIKAAVVLLLASTFAACATRTNQQPSPTKAASLELSQKIIGKWREDGSGIITEYFTNRTLNMIDPTDKVRGSNTITFNWKVLDNRQVELFPLVLGVRKPKIVTITFPQPDVMLINDSIQRRVK
jgi:hypothetical protein